MATLNKKRKATQRFIETTHAGAPAKRNSALESLERSVMACLLWEDTFYEEGESIADRIARYTAEVSLQDASRIAIAAREEAHMRHAPLWIVREMARKGGMRGSYLIGNTLARVIQRPDELTEFLSIYWKDGKTPLSAQVKKGLAQAFTKFDEYQLAKYNRQKEVTLRDVLFLTHPSPETRAQQEMWNRLVENKLETPDTWEVALSNGGNAKEEWTRLLAENRLGGLALLRNLRNMERAGVDSTLIRKAIRENSFNRVLPFRFISASQHVPMLEDALEEAMFRATAEMQKLPGKTALILDNSGSMYWDVAGRSSTKRVDAAAGLAMLLREICEEPVIIGFGTTAGVLPSRRGFALGEAYRNGPGGGTNTETAKKLADKHGYDRIIILTDEQSHQSITSPAKGAKGYVVNVGTYKNGIGYGPWTTISGWSESVVRYIQSAEGL